MAPLLRRPTRVTCFFCQSTVDPPPANPHAFVCPHCTCRNRYDTRGEIMSDEPAMHDESLNRKSFAKRASPRKDRFLSTFGPAPFCTACQSNQRLLLQFLSSYLPASDDPEYARRLASYDSYKESVYARYPPVCANCAPLVDEEIRKKDIMARSNALGRWLTDSRGIHRPASRSKFDRRALAREVRWWRVRGAMCLVTLAMVFLGELGGALGYRPLYDLGVVAPYLPIYFFVSILWTAWDPTWASLRQAQLQGRKVRVRGKNGYAILQTLVWVYRLTLTSFISAAHFRPSSDILRLHAYPASLRSRVYFGCSLLLELLVRPFPAAHTPTSNPIQIATDSPALIHRPPSQPTARRPPHRHLTRPLRNTLPPLLSTIHILTNTNTKISTTRFSLDSLTLTSAAAPETSHPSPIFGLPSLLRPPNSQPPTSAIPSTPTSAIPNGEYDDDDDETRDPDAMDWSPTSPPTGLWRRDVRPPTDEATGLESLLARTNIAERPVFPDARAERAGGAKSGDRPRWKWGWVYALSLVPLAAVAYVAWSGVRHA